MQQVFRIYESVLSTLSSHPARGRKAIVQQDGKPKGLVG